MIPLITCWGYAGMLIRFMMLPIIPRIKTPRRVLTAFPFPPFRLAPPITTAAITSRGLEIDHMPKVADLIDRVILNPENEQSLSSVRIEVNELMSHRPLFAG